MRAPAVTFPVLCAGLLLVAACGSRTSEVTPTPDAAPVGAVAHLDDARYLGAALDVGNLRVWPVHTTAPLDVGEFLTLQEAQEQGVAEVREIGGPGQVGGNRERQRGRGGVQIDIPTQTGQIDVAQADEQIGQVLQLANGGGAQVGSLVIENKGELPLLVCAGTVVKGGNQDRQIGQDIVVAAGETVPVDAFCVEAGRWTNVREGVANDGQFVALKTMTAKNVRAKGQYEDDQSGVWQEVAEVRTRSLSPVVGAGAGGEGSTLVAGTTFVDALEKVDDDTREARASGVETILAHFTELADGDAPPIGFAYAVNGEAQGVRVFAHERLLRQNLESFASTIVIEAEVAGATPHDPCGADAVVAMVEAIEKDAQQRREQTQASNVNVIYSNRYGFNGNCYVQDADGEEVPVTQDWTRK